MEGWRDRGREGGTEEEERDEGELSAYSRDLATHSVISTLGPHDPFCTGVVKPPFMAAGGSWGNV
jgi:hypothetical protein